MNYKLALLLAILMISCLLIVSCGSFAPSTSAPSPIPAAQPSVTSPATSPASTTAVAKPATSAPAPSASPAAPTASTNPGAAPGSPKNGGTFKLAWDSSPAGSVGWPAEMPGDAGFASQMVFEPLLRSDPKGNLFPGLALSYQYSSDNMSISFALRKGVKFHDGTDFNAQAAKWNLDTIIAAKLQPFWKSVDAVDDYTVRVNLNRWTNSIINSFADVSTSWMVSPTAYQQRGLDWIRANPVGTGPFKFVSFQRDTSYNVVRNSDYWQKGTPYLDGVQVLYISDSITRKFAALSGALDMMTINPGQLSVDMANAGFSIKTKMETINVLMGDSANPDSPYSKQAVREAIEYAIDREALASAFGFGYWKAPYQIPARSTAAYDANFSLGRKYDPVKAKQLLTDAGYPNGFKTTIAVGPTTGYDRNAVVALQAYLGRIGIQAELQFPDFGTWNTNFIVGPPRNTLIYAIALGRANYCTNLTDWSTASPNYKNWTRSATFTDLVNKALNSNPADPVMIKAATDQLTREAQIIPINETGRNFAIQPYVMGGNWFERSLAPWWSSETAWLNK